LRAFILHSTQCELAGVLDVGQHRLAGHISRRQLYHARFDSLDLKKVEAVSRAGQGPGEFLFNLGGMAIVKAGADHPPARPGGPSWWPMTGIRTGRLIC